MSEQIKNLDVLVDTLNAIDAEVKRSAVGNDPDITAAIGVMALGANGLYEGPPGTGKTHTSKAIAAAFGGKFGRIQGTADTLPSDITGGDVYNLKTKQYEPLFGPIFADIVLVDEISRIQPRGQSGFLEPMGERQVTFTRSGTHKLPEGAAMYATQNPYATNRETYPLPGAQRDRFVASIWTEITDAQREEIAIRALNPHTPTEVVTKEAMREVQLAVPKVHLELPMTKLALATIAKVKQHKNVDLADGQMEGVRDVIDLQRFAQYHALKRKSEVVEKQDIDFAAPYVLAHRFDLSERALTDNLNGHEVVRDAVA